MQDDHASVASQKTVRARRLMKDMIGVAYSANIDDMAVLVIVTIPDQNNLTAVQMMATNAPLRVAEAMLEQALESAPDHLADRPASKPS